MVEVHTIVSEAPHLRSSIPHPKTDFSKNQIASRRIIPWPKSTKPFFPKSRFFIPTIWGQGPTFFRNKIAEMCYLYRTTDHRGSDCMTISALSTLICATNTLSRVAEPVSGHNIKYSTSCAVSLHLRPLSPCGEIVAHSQQHCPSPCIRSVSIGYFE